MEYTRAQRAKEISANSSAVLDKFGRKLKDSSSQIFGRQDDNSDEENAKDEEALAQWLGSESGATPSSIKTALKAHVSVPTQEDMQAIFLAEKKKMLLGKFGV